MRTHALEVLDVAAVMDLYGLQDRRSARRIMDEAGAFLIGGRLLVRREALLAHERALAVQRRAGTLERAAAAERVPRARRRRPTEGRREPLSPDWWRENLPLDRETA